MGEGITVECFQTHPRLWYDGTRQALLGIQIRNIPPANELTSLRVCVDTDLAPSQMTACHLVRPEHHYSADFVRAPEVLTAGTTPGMFTGRALLPAGQCFLWVLADLHKARVGAEVDAALESMTLGGHTYGAEAIINPAPSGGARVYNPRKRVYAHQRARMMIWHPDKPPAEIFDYVTDIGFCGLGAGIRAPSEKRIDI